MNIKNDVAEYFWSEELPAKKVRVFVVIKLRKPYPPLPPIEVEAVKRPCVRIKNK